MMIFKPTRSIKFDLYGTVSLLVFSGLFTMICVIILHRNVFEFIVTLLLFALILSPFFYLIPMYTIKIDEDEIIAERFLIKRAIKWNDVVYVEEQWGVAPFNFFGSFIIIKSETIKIKFVSRVDKFEELKEIIFKNLGVPKWPKKKEEQYRVVFQKN